MRFWQIQPDLSAFARPDIAQQRVFVHPRDLFRDHVWFLPFIMPASDLTAEKQLDKVFSQSVCVRFVNYDTITEKRNRKVFQENKDAKWLVYHEDFFRAFC